MLSELRTFQGHDGVGGYSAIPLMRRQRRCKKLLAIETDITKWQQKQNMNNNFSANIPYSLEQMRKEIKGFR